MRSFCLVMLHVIRVIEQVRQDEMKIPMPEIS